MGCDKQNMDLVLNNIKGKNLEELMAEGAEKLASVGGGCGGGAAPAASEDAPAAKKEEKKEESEEEDDDMGFGLFDQIIISLSIVSYDVNRHLSLRLTFLIS